MKSLYRFYVLSFAFRMLYFSNLCLQRGGLLLQKRQQESLLHNHPFPKKIPKS